MKIIVDEMPKESKDCICFHNGFCTILSDTDTRRSCYKDICPLKPISDCHAYKVLQTHNGNMTMAEVFDIL